MDPLLSVKELVSGYRQLRVLQGVSMDVLPGGITAIIGPNGHGKSTLLRTIAGLMPAWSGTVRFKGKELPNGAPNRAREGLVLVPQGDQLFTGMTVEENLLMGAYTRKDASAIQHTLSEVYALFPRLLERRSQRANSLSGGERRMVGIGRGMMADAAPINTVAETTPEPAAPPATAVPAPGSDPRAAAPPPPGPCAGPPARRRCPP
jgi:branched-chain amino acid transport system ATP-binding protein